MLKDEDIENIVYRPPFDLTDMNSFLDWWNGFITDPGTPWAIGGTLFLCLSFYFVIWIVIKRGKNDK